MQASYLDRKGLPDNMIYWKRISRIPFFVFQLSNRSVILCIYHEAKNRRVSTFRITNTMEINWICATCLYWSLIWPYLDVCMCVWS